MTSMQATTAIRAIFVALLALVAIGVGGCATRTAPADATGAASGDATRTVSANAAGAVPVDVESAARVLAPGGRLRVGVYRGSPTSLVKDVASGEDRGVTVDLGRELAARLGVRYEQVEFPRVAAVLEALKLGKVDFTVTNATPARAADVDFTAPLVDLELGYLVVQGSRVTTIGDIDRPGIRVGVSQGSTSQATLSKQYRNATLVTAPSLDVAAGMLRSGEVDAFATNKGILYEMADRLPGAKVLDGRWGQEHLAIAIPKGRDAAMPYVRRFAESAKAERLVARAADRAGLRGTAEPAGR